MNVIVHMTECKPNSTIASARVARFVVDTLQHANFILADTKQKAEAALVGGAAIEHLIIVNGPMAFCDFLDELAVLVRRAAKVIWIQQDYTINPPAQVSEAQSPFRRIFAERNLRPDFWTTVKKSLKTENDHYINWNQLTYDPQPFPPLATKVPTLLYYGAYRERREQDFKFYFADAPYRVHISTTPIRGKKFKKLCDRILIIPPFIGLDKLPECSASLYIEDDRSHTEFHSPANRFYELLSAGIPIFFDVRTTKMLGEAGILPHPHWVVNSKQDLYNKMQTTDLHMMRQTQRDRWHDDYKEELRKRLVQIWRHYEVPGST